MDFDTLFLRFEHIAQAILEQLDDDTLIKSQQVCHSWNTFLNENRIWRKHWLEKLEKIVTTTKKQPIYSLQGGYENISILDAFSRTKALYEHYTKTDLSLSKLQTLVLGLKAGIVQKDKNPTEFWFVDPFQKACKNGNIEFIKLCEECPIEI